MSITRFIVLIGLFVALSLGRRTFYPDCTAPPTSYCQRTNCNVWYVDGNAGKIDGDGTSDNPFINVTMALMQLQAKQIAKGGWSLYGPFPIAESNLTVVNPNGKILPGDVIVLRTANYDDPKIFNIYVDVPLTIMGQPGHRPVFDHFTLQGTSNFIITCLNFTTSTPGGDDIIVNFVPIGFMVSGAPSYNNVFTKNTIYSYTDINYFKGKDSSVLFNASSSGYQTRDSLYNTISHNYLYGVRRAIIAISEYQYIGHNVANYLTGDGFRIMHNNTLVEHNLIMNSMNADNGFDHRDGMQLFTVADRFNLFNITIRNNVLIADEDKTRPHFDGFQGISSFDVIITNVTVENNLITTIWNWNGIVMSKSVNCKIIGNTVLDVSLNGTYYLWVTTTKGISGNVVQNNIAHQAGVYDGVVSLNSNVNKRWSMQDLTSYFVDPFNYNMRLKANASSPFIGKGNSTNAPIYDNDGNIRGGAYDVGCYAFNPLDPNTNTPVFGSTPDFIGVPASDTPYDDTPSSNNSPSGGNNPSNGSPNGIPSGNISKGTSTVYNFGFVSLMMLVVAGVVSI